MALTIRGHEPYIDTFKTLTGEKTASRALIEAARIGVTASAELSTAKQRIADLEASLSSYQQIISKLQQACAHISEIAAQQDMLITQ